MSEKEKNKKSLSSAQKQRSLEKRKVKGEAFDVV